MRIKIYQYALNEWQRARFNTLEIVHITSAQWNQLENASMVREKKMCLIKIEINAKMTEKEIYLLMWGIEKAIAFPVFSSIYKSNLVFDGEKN